MAGALRIGVMQLTMEPVREMVASAQAMDDAGLDTIWLAEVTVDDRASMPCLRHHG